MPENIDPEISRDEYLDNRRATLDVAKHNIVVFDKAILTLSSGALAVSLAFIDKIGGIANSNYVWVLGIAWLCYLISILANLQSHRTGWKDAYGEIARQDRRYKDTGNFDLTPSKQRNKIESLNDAAFWFFALGTILLCTFALINLGILKDDQETKSEPAATAASASTTANTNPRWVSSGKRTPCRATTTSSPEEIVLL